jgi:hypothetical protein
MLERDALCPISIKHTRQTPDRLQHNRFTQFALLASFNAKTERKQMARITLNLLARAAWGKFLRTG